MKLIQMRSPGGATNYNERMMEIGLRSLDDFKEAYARLHAIAIGLREFYGIEVPSDTDLNDLKQSRTRIEGAIRWIRKAANALSRAKMDEQEIVVRKTIEPTKGHKLLDELAAKSGKAIRSRITILMIWEARD